MKLIPWLQPKYYVICELISLSPVASLQCWSCQNIKLINHLSVNCLLIGKHLSQGWGWYFEKDLWCYKSLFATAAILHIAIRIVVRVAIWIIWLIYQVNQQKYENHWFTSHFMTVQVLTTACLADSLAFAALRHIALRILRRVLPPSAAKKKGLHSPRLRLTLTCHVNYWILRDHISRKSVIIWGIG